MNFHTRPLIDADLSLASTLDHKWFGEYGISITELREYINQHPTESIALLGGNSFSGFVTFETLSESSIPRNYVGKIPKVEKVLFIQQFTTTTNYAKDDMSMDRELLEAVELKAKELECDEIWEALATTHPYSSAINRDFDAFGFYRSKGYTYDPTNLLTWAPDNTISIPCYLFRKKLL